MDINDDFYTYSMIPTYDYKISLEDVFNAYYDCRKNKRKTFNAIEFEINYESKLIELWRELNTKTYEIGKSICFLVRRPKLREVFAADFRDRIVHHIVCKKLEPLFECAFIQDSYNCRKGKGTSYGIKRLHQQIKEVSKNYEIDCYVGKFDMKGFFMSIHRPTLWKILEQFIEVNYHDSDKELIKWLVHKIVNHAPEKNCIIKGNRKEWERLGVDKSLFTCGDEYGLPIGNLTSQMFANYYLHELDYKLSKYFDGYGRYVDDFYIIDRDKQKIINSISNIEKYLKNSRQVTLHPHKRYIQHMSKGCIFTGAVVKMDRIYMGNYTRSQFYNKIQYFNKMMELNPNWLDDDDHKKQFRSSINCYLGFAKQFTSFKLMIKHINMINKNWERYGTLHISCQKIVMRD